MGAALINESYWTCRKRWDLERYLRREGWDPLVSAKHRGPMSGAECGANVLAYLDTRDDPSGSMAHLSPERVEELADWRGDDGLLYRALCDTGWVDDPGTEKARWHDYASFNSKRIAGRLRQRKKREAEAEKKAEQERDSQASSAESRGQSRTLSRGQSRGESRPQQDYVRVQVSNPFTGVTELARAPRLNGGAGHGPPSFDDLPKRKRARIADEARASGVSSDHVIEQLWKQGAL